MPEMSVGARVAEQIIGAGGSISARLVRELLREIIRCEHPSLRAAARAWGVSPAYVSNAIRGGTVGPKLLCHLGLERRVVIRYCAPRKESSDE